MKSYFDVRQELAKYNISMIKDIQKFANTIKGIAEYGYEPQKVLKEFDGIQYLVDKRQALEIAIYGYRTRATLLQGTESSGFWYSH